MTFADDLLVRRAVAAATRHRELAPAIRALAADLTPAGRGGYERLAAALASGREADVAAAAAADPALWMPLIVHDSPVSALDGLAQVAAQPPQPLGSRWRVLAYPLVVVGIALVVLFFAGTLVLPMFDVVFEDFGMQQPVITTVVRLVLVQVTSGWKLLSVGAAAIIAARFIMIRRSPRGPEVTAAYTATLADLVGGGFAADDAVTLAARSVGVRPADRARPSRPLTAAAAAALDLPAAAGSHILRALSANHSARGRASVETLEWMIGPVAVGVAGCIVGLVVVALFMPLIQLVNDLS